MPELRARARAAVTAGTIALAAAGCTQIDNALAAVPFFAFMREAPSFDPYEAPRPLPEHAVPFVTPMGEALPPLEPAEAALQAFAAGPWGVNPLPAGDSAVLALGQAMYERYCFVCHGTAGTGDGPIVGAGKFPALVTNLTLAPSVGRADGYIYAVVRAGRGLMPAYGGRMTHTERWAVVHYVRALQQQAGAAGAPAGGAPTAPADTTGTTPAAADTAATQGAED